VERRGTNVESILYEGESRKEKSRGEGSTCGKTIRGAAKGVEEKSGTHLMMESTGTLKRASQMRHVY